MNYTKQADQTGHFYELHQTSWSNRAFIWTTPNKL